jgi:cation diffusion facilitator CzcD-associated flavoprotein CzcO
VGAGPNALSLAAHLRARRVDFRVFGPAMKFWRDMPSSINLKSFAFATNIYVPEKGHTFPEWCRARGLEDFEPCTMASFAAYGMEMRARFVPDLDPTGVSRVSVGAGGLFNVLLADGRNVRSRRVVFATGLTHLAYTPKVLSSLPPELASHTSDHKDYAVFRGKEVAIVGAGASAIEAGALVRESGGSAQILVRGAEAIFHGKMSTRRSLYERLRSPNSVVGPGIKARLMQAFPLAPYFIPQAQRLRLVERHFGPSAPWWIKDRVLGHVPIRTSTSVVGAERAGGRVRLRLQEAGRGERTLEVDHVVAGTGYVPDIDRLEYLDPDLRRRLERLQRGPALSMNFESSVPGAYFIGPVAMLSFGPLFRFVAAADYTAPALARHLAGLARPARRSAPAIGTLASNQLLRR